MGAGGLGALGGGRIRLVAVLVPVVLAMLPAAAGAASQAPDARLAAVIVRTQPGALAAVARQTERLGGQVGRQLPIIGGFSARLPGGAVERLAGSPGTVAVTEDERVAMQAAAYAPTTDAGPCTPLPCRREPRPTGRPVGPARASTWP